MADADQKESEVCEPEKRVRTLTEKGEEMFENRVLEYKTKLNSCYRAIEVLLSQVSEEKSLSALEKLECELVALRDKYSSESSLYHDFLQRESTPQSQKEIEILNIEEGGCVEKIKSGFQRLCDLKQRLPEVASVTSRSTSSSKLTAKLAMKQAEATAARVRLQYAEQEATLRRQQAALEADAARKEADAARKKEEMRADLVILEQRKEVAATEAEIQALQSVDLDQARPDPFPDIRMSDHEATTRTRQYVEEHFNTIQTTHDEKETYLPRAPEPHASYRAPEPHASYRAPEPHASYRAPEPHASYRAPEPQAPYRAPDQLSICSDLTRFLLKKDLLLSRLCCFEDKPEVYAVWKSSFQSIMRDLQVSPFEELDMLVKWLGPESRRYAISVRNSNTGSPERGLTRIWERLDERYGSVEMIESAIKLRLSRFPKLTPKDDKKFYELADLVSEIEAIKDDQQYRSLFAYYDSSSGVLPIINKLPHGLQEKWTYRASEYKRRHGVSFPPFSFLCNFIREISRIKNDPGFVFEARTTPSTTQVVKPNNKHSVAAKKTEAKEDDTALEILCPLHNTKHSLKDCKGFKAKPISERRKFLKDNHLCFKCTSDKHSYHACKEILKCKDCGSNRHITAMHDQSAPQQLEKPHGGEKPAGDPTSVSSKCTQICPDRFSGKSCAKTVLVRVYREGHPEQAFKTYAIIDDQSNRSLARSDFFAFLDTEDDEVQYTLSSCNGCVTTSGRKASGLIVESLDGGTQMELPTILECNQLPDLREEIPTPDVAQHHAHLHEIAKYIPPLDNSANILLLIGRDLIEAHHVLDQRIGPRNSPYAQRLHLGWVIVGEACLGKTHRPDVVNVVKTQVLSSGRPTTLPPCPFDLKVDPQKELGETVFQVTKDDNKIGLSIEDKQFLRVMDSEFNRGKDGYWTAPLPFKTPRKKLPNNRPQALKRAKALDASLRKDVVKKKHFTEFMQKILDKGHAEIAPATKDHEEIWYLPIFGVYHPKKPNQIRAVFDSSAKSDGVSLNDVLLTGPDLTNNLVGVLIRFRREPVAVVCDIQQMFYGFQVTEQHRNYLRFLWYRDNNLQNELTDYRMCVHVFGNSPSPAVATYGLRKIVELSQGDSCQEVTTFVERDFYVDDGLASLPTEQEAVHLIQKTQSVLQEGGRLRLHKIASNRESVMKAFSNDDLASDLKDLDLGSESLPTQRSLGLNWCLSSDSFSFSVSLRERPFTRRGVLSTVSSVFDPLGLVAPVIVQGKLLLKEFMASTTDWDTPLPASMEEDWNTWKDSLKCLEDLKIPRTYSSRSLTTAVKRELHVFSDASEKAIAAIAYLKAFYEDGDVQIGFVLGKAKVAPTHGHTIPRLELCAALLGSELAETVTDQLDYNLDRTAFYTDSKVVLGYLNNVTRRFQVYVSNRVERIRRVSTPDQWNYVPTHLNPADCGTRGVHASNIQHSPWLVGSDYMRQETQPPEPVYPLVDPDQDKEIKSQVQTMKTKITDSIGSDRFSRFSTWKALVGSIAFLKAFIRNHRSDVADSSEKQPSSFSEPVLAFQDAERFIVHATQCESYMEEMRCLKDSVRLPKNSPILLLNPIIDEHGLLRVGGRLSRGLPCSPERNPLIIPKHSHVATLLIRHYHEQVSHQGRHFTEGAIRSAGYWILGAKRLISAFLQKCLTCRKLRGKLEFQKMADLPQDRLEPGPPFSAVGVDVFGPWQVVARRTRGGQAHSKRWAVLFTCLTSRAIHIEVIEEMSTSCFINALRRFVSIRGPVKEFRSDCGTNFVGSTQHLKVDVIGVEQDPVKDFLLTKGTTWRFNPPHASHMGGVWERMIGRTRKILDSMMSRIAPGRLTHEVLITFMAEVCAIVNARPLVPVSYDPESPALLCPSMLLTQKTPAVADPFECAEVCPKDMYKAQWKQVQMLADTFWKRWSKEYLDSLQGRRKWHEKQPNLKEGDIVLLREKDIHRNDWPIAVVNKVFPSEDGIVRKTEVRVPRGDKQTVYVRPVTELVLLLSE